MHLHHLQLRTKVSPQVKRAGCLVNVFVCRRANAAMNNPSEKVALACFPPPFSIKVCFARLALDIGRWDGILLRNFLIDFHIDRSVNKAAVFERFATDAPDDSDVVDDFSKWGFADSPCGRVKAELGEHLV